jgi:uncharacterized protein YdeI (YjbR/CyaY-like superfamily)
MPIPNLKADVYTRKPGQWQEAFQQLRAILLGTELAEDFKWGHPCYTFNGQNVVLMHGFKEYCALLFMKGALMQDPEEILVQQTENVQSARQIRFTSAQQITRMKKVLKAYIDNAIEVEQSGAKVTFKSTEEFELPEEFERKLEDMPQLRTAFEDLTPGRQRAYLLHFSSAKQARTRESRIEKCIPFILSGKGLND